MVGDERILGLILARKGSKRLPGKNRFSLANNKMLVDFAIDAMREAPEINRYAISTDDDVLGLYCLNEGLLWIERPPDLCTSKSDISGAIEHAFNFISVDYVVSFQCAVPLRPVGSTSALIQEVLKTGAKGGLSVIKRTPWMWKIHSDSMANKWWYRNQYPRSQDIPVNTYEEINAIQVTHKSIIGKRWGYPLSFVELPSWADFDIDDREDFKKCCRLWPKLATEYCVEREYNTFTIQGEL